MVMSKRYIGWNRRVKKRKLSRNQKRKDRRDNERMERQAS